MWLDPSYYLAESEGFEPPLAFTKTVFKTAAFDRSANSPFYIINIGKRI